jgi:glycosyltransferase involved in cell wall biosynthesis
VVSFLYAREPLDWSRAHRGIIALTPAAVEQAKKVTFQELMHEHYAACSASLIIQKNDPTEYTANGFTNLIEALALARLVVITRTGSLPGEIDVERAGCGLHVPPEDPRAIADAIDALARDPQQAQAMGQQGRRLCESHYNIDRYAGDLHRFFESL